MVGAVGRCGRVVAVRLVLLLAAGVGAVLAVWGLASSPAAADQASPGTFPLIQPDGSQIVARQWGDEWYHGFETAEGYTIVQRTDGYWVYARQKSDGGLRGSGQVAGLGTPAGPRHLRDELAASAALEERTSSQARGSQRRDDRGSEVRVDQSVTQSPQIGTAPVLIILAQFTDRTSLGTTPAMWHDRFFGVGKTVADYYDKASRGALDLVPATETSGTANDGVVGWVNLPMANPGWVGDKHQNDLASREAIIAAAPYVDFAAYDVDDDGVVTNTELHIVVVAAGLEASYKGADPAHNVWAHRGELFPDDIPNVDGTWVGGWGYVQLGEIHGKPGDPSHVDHQATLGIIVHELGHDLGLPDLYDYDYDSEGVGKFSLMASGEWGTLPTDQFLGQTPVLLDGWSRATLGWITPDRVNGTSMRTLNAAAGATGSGLAVVLGQNPFGYDWNWYDRAGGEYFLVENRQPIPGSYDETLPGGGLLVLHIEEASDDNTTVGARIVDVEEADGLSELDGLTNEGDGGDLWPGTSDRRSFGAGTTPNSNWNDQTLSGAAISSISDSGLAMTATFTGPPNAAPRNDAFAQAITVTPGWSGYWSHRTNNELATIQQPVGEATQGTCSLGKTVWYRFTPPRDMYLEAFTTGSSFDTVMNLWRGDQLGALTAQGCNDEAAQNSGYSYLSQRVVQGGQTYYLQVGGWASNATTVAGGDLALGLYVYPFNDLFTQSATLAGPSGVMAGNSQYSARDAGEPAHAGQRYTGSVWYRWTPTTSGPVVFDTLASADPDTVLAVYTGATVGTLTPVASNDDVGGGNLRSKVSFQAVAGTTYRIAVGHKPFDAGAPGFTLTWGPPAASPSSPPSITGTPRYGEQLSVDNGAWPGVNGFAYSWRRDGIALGGATGATYTPGRDDVGHQLTVTVTGSGPGLAAGSATTAGVVVDKARPGFGESAKNAHKRAKGVIQGRKIVLTFTVGPWADGGKVTAVLGGKKRTTATVASGKVVLRMSTAKVKPGKKVRLVLTYDGTAIAASAVKTYTVRVKVPN